MILSNPKRVLPRRLLSPRSHNKSLLLEELLTSYREMERAGDDYTQAFKFLGKIEDTESKLIGMGMTRERISEYVNKAFESERTYPAPQML